jgi:hypothetical protein
MASLRRSDEWIQAQDALLISLQENASLLKRTLGTKCEPSINSVGLLQGVLCGYNDSCPSSSENHRLRDKKDTWQRLLPTGETVNISILRKVWNLVWMTWTVEKGYTNARRQVSTGDWMYGGAWYLGTLSTNLLHVTLLAPRILRWPPYFCKICAPP